MWNVVRQKRLSSLSARRPQDFEKCKTLTFHPSSSLNLYLHQCLSCMFWAEQNVAKTFVKRCYLHLLLGVATPRCRLTLWKSGNPRQAAAEKKTIKGVKFLNICNRVYIMEQHFQTVHWRRGQLMQILAIPRIPLWHTGNMSGLKLVVFHMPNPYWKRGHLQSNKRVLQFLVWANVLKVISNPKKSVVPKKVYIVHKPYWGEVTEKKPNKNKCKKSNCVP